MVINMQFANSHASKPFFYYVLQNGKMILCQAKNDIFELYGLWAFVWYVIGVNMSFFPRKLRKTLSGSMMVRIRHKLRYNRCWMLCYVHIGLFLERTNPVVNPVVASQKLLRVVSPFAVHHGRHHYSFLLIFVAMCADYHEIFVSLNN